MNLAAFEFRKFFKSPPTVFVVGRKNRQRHQHFVGVQTRIVAAQIVDLGVLDRLDHVLRNQFHSMVYAGQMLGGVEYKGRTRSEQHTRLRGNDGAVGQLYCRTRHSATLGSAAGGIDRPAVGGVDLGLLEKQGDLVDLAVVAVALGQPVQSIVVAAYDLVFRRITAYFVIIYAESHHVHAHIGRGFIGILTVYALEKGIQHRKYLYVTVIVDCRGTVCFKMKRVDHVHIVEVGRSGFVCDVDRMFQRQAPHWKCFKFGISGLDTALVFIVKLTQAHGHFAASGPRGSDDDKRTGSLNIIVAAETVVGVNQFHICGIAIDGIVIICGDLLSLQTLPESIGAALTVVVRDDHRAYQKSTVLKLIAQPQHVHIVCDSQIAAHLVFFDVKRAYHNHDLGLVTQLGEHAQFAVGLESRQHAAGVMIVEKLSAEFKIKFIAELGYALLDVLGLDSEIFLVVKTVFHNGTQRYGFLSSQFHRSVNKFINIP